MPARDLLAILRGAPTPGAGAIRPTPPWLPAPLRALPVGQGDGLSAEGRAAVALAERLYAAMNGRDLAALLAALTPDVELRQSELLPWGGVHHGHDGVRTVAARLLALIDSQVAIDRLVPTGDRVVMIGRTRGAVRATGRAFDIPAIHVWTLRDGRAARFEAYIDTPAMLAALDA